MSSGARAIVAGHGDFAAGMLSAVTQITGRADAFLPVAVHGLGAEDIERTLLARAEEHGITVVFTDLPAGSCTVAVRRLQRERPELVLVAGANLAALLDFLFHEQLPAGEAARHAADKGRASIIVAGAARDA